MARPIEYDFENVLRNAMQLFWQKGYQATSISDLVKATGLTTRSMYNLFDDKDGFFRAALEKFKKDILIMHAYKPLETNRGQAGLRAFFFDYLANPHGFLHNGCLFVNTLSERHVVNDVCLAITQEHFAKLERLFVQKLEEAVEDGEFSGDVELTAKMILLMVQGGGLYVKGAANAENLSEVYADFFNRIGFK